MSYRVEKECLAHSNTSYRVAIGMSYSRQNVLPRLASVLSKIQSVGGQSNQVTSISIGRQSTYKEMQWLLIH